MKKVTRISHFRVTFFKLSIYCDIYFVDLIELKNGKESRI